MTNITFFWFFYISLKHFNTFKTEKRGQILSEKLKENFNCEKEDYENSSYFHKEKPEINFIVEVNHSKKADHKVSDT